MNHVALDEDPMSIPTKIEHEPFYPASDGAPMGETTVHVEAIFLLHMALQEFFRARRDVLVASDLFWYWEKGNPASCCAPDTMVVLGTDPGDRRSFFSWREKKPTPNTVFEIASENTWRENMDAKRELYERLQVPEYFIFDPLVEFLNPPLRGFRLRGKTYRPVKPAADGSLVSKELGLRLVPAERMLRLIDAQTGEKVLTPYELVEQAKQSAEQERQRAEQQAQRAVQAEQLAERERQERQALETELARLRALLAKPPDPSTSDGG
jgi:Uma2 family endonuclease